MGSGKALAGLGWGHHELALQLLSVKVGGWMPRLEKLIKVG